MRTADRVADLRVGTALAREQHGSLQVQHQAGQRVGEHIVHLAGQALALGQRGGFGLRRPGLLQLADQKFSPLVALR